jgi:hypothetical protein
MPLLFRHLVVLVDIGALCEADRDSILGATPQRDARGGACCFRRRARRADFSFDATPGKLPKTAVPISYSIELRPGVESLALPEVVFDIDVREPTARLTLNAVNTVFASVTVDDAAERADLKKSRALPAIDVWIRPRR